MSSTCSGAGYARVYRRRQGRCRIVSAELFKELFLTDNPASSAGAWLGWGDYARVYNSLVNEHNERVRKLWAGENGGERRSLLLEKRRIAFAMMSLTRLFYTASRSEGAGFRTTYMRAADAPLVRGFSPDNLSSYSYEISLGCVVAFPETNEFLVLKPGDELVLEPEEPVIVVSREFISTSDLVSGVVRTRLSLHLAGLRPVSHKLDPSFHGYVMFSLLNENREKVVTLTVGSERIADVRFDLDSGRAARYSYESVEVGGREWILETIHRDLLDYLWARRDEIRGSWNAMHSLLLDFFAERAGGFERGEALWDAIIDRYYRAYALQIVRSSGMAMPISLDGSNDVAVLNWIRDILKEMVDRASRVHRVRSVRMYRMTLLRSLIWIAGGVAIAAIGASAGNPYIFAESAVIGGLVAYTGWLKYWLRD